MFQILLSMAREGTSDSISSSPARQGRDSLITTVYKLHRTRLRVLEPYRKLKNSLKQLQEDYLHSKQNNVLIRYSKLQSSLRDVVVLEKQYWKLLEVPTQDPGEENADYVSRVVDLLEGTPVQQASGIGALLGAVAIRTESRLDGTLYDAIRSQSLLLSEYLCDSARKTEELQKEADNLFIQLHRLLKKYLGLRKLVRQLTEKYGSTRSLPILPRYSILKKMIKNALRAPEFAEICHEQVE